MAKNQYPISNGMKHVQITTLQSALTALAGVVLVIATLFPAIAAAETVFRYGSDVVVASDQTIDGDFYAFSGRWWTPGEVSVSGAIEGDMYTIGDTITINGSVSEDIAAAGFDVQIHGPVDDDVRIIADKVVIADEVGGDVFVVAENLTILSSATVTGNVYFYGTKAEITGDVEGSLHGNARTWRIDSFIGEGIDVTAGNELTLGARANVVGDVVYTSNSELIRATQSVVEGDIVRAEQTVVEEGRSTLGALIPMFAVVFAAFFLFLLMRDEHAVFARRVTTHYARNFILGLVTLLLAPLVAVFLMVTILGAVLGGGVLFAYLLLLVLALIALPLTFGAITRKLYAGTTTTDFTTILVGAVVLLLATLVPVIGGILILVALTIALGAMVNAIYQRLR